LISFYLFSICIFIFSPSACQYVCCRVLYSYLINTEYTYIHAAVTIYVLEGTPPERIYQVDAADPENAELKVSCIKEKTQR